MSEQIELRWILMVVRRWIWLIVACAFLGGLTALIVTYQMDTKYEATVTLLIQPALDSRSSEYSALIAGEQLALTYSEMIKGQPVLETVVSQNHLDESSEQLAKRITVQPIRDTQLVNLTVQDVSPEQAVLLSNVISQEFIKYIQTLQTERYAGTLENIQDQMAALTLQMEELQSEIETLNTQKVENEVELAQLESQLQDYSNRNQQLQNEYQTLQMASSTLTESIRVIQSAQAAGVISPTLAVVTLFFDQASFTKDGVNLVNTYETILTSQSVMEAAITKLGLDIDPDALAKKISVAPVPDTQLIQLSVRDADVSQAILLADTIADVFIDQLQVSQAKPYTDRMSSIQAETDLLQQQVTDTQVDIASLNSEIFDLDTQIDVLKGQLVEYRSDHRTLQQDYNQTQLTTVNAADAVVIAEPATVAKISAQHGALYIALAIMVSAMIGLGTAFVIEYLNDVVRTPDDITRMDGLSTLGSIGFMNGSANGVLMVDQPRAPISEAFRLLATNIRMSGIDQPLRTILVTSPHARAGKSVVIANLAATFAQRELRVVLVDADLRLPQQHNLFDLNQSSGLTGALLNGNVSNHLQQVKTEGLQILTSGDLPPNPAEMVASKRMQKLLEEVTQDADLVLIDCPPVLPVADASILASIVDGVILVAMAGQTRRQEVRDAVENLRKVDSHLLGVVLNGVSNRSDRYYRYYGGKTKEGTTWRHWLKKSILVFSGWFGEFRSRMKKRRQAKSGLSAKKKPYRISTISEDTETGPST